MGKLATLLMKIFVANSLFVQLSASYNILALFHHPGQSHFAFFEPLLRGLAEKGHNLTVLGYFPLKDPPENYHDVVMEANVPLRNEMDLKVSCCWKKCLRSIERTNDWLYCNCNKLLCGCSLEENQHFPCCFCYMFLLNMFEWNKHCMQASNRESVKSILQKCVSQIISFEIFRLVLCLIFVLAVVANRKSQWSLIWLKLFWQIGLVVSVIALHCDY